MTQSQAILDKTRQTYLKNLQQQLVYHTKRKQTPASKLLKSPAQVIDAHSFLADKKGDNQISFMLADKQMSWEQGQALTYKADCNGCRKRKAVIAVTIYRGRNAVWPPDEGFPDRCPACAAKPQPEPVAVL